MTDGSSPLHWGANDGDATSGMRRGARRWTLHAGREGSHERHLLGQSPGREKLS